MKYISKSDIDIIKELIDLHEVECCGNLLEDETEQNLLTLFIEVVGETSSCTNETYKKYQWHTHSKVSKGYPSPEDILLPVRKRPTHCLIFTIFGIYEIICYKKDRNMDKEKKEYYMKKYIQPNLNEIYYKTEQGRSKNLTEEQILYINHYLKEIEKILRYKKIDIYIYFTPWKEITDMYVLH